MARTDTTKITADFSDFGQTMVRESFSIWAGFGERVSTIALDAAEKNAEIASTATQETISNMRELAAVREDASDYARVYGDFAQKQAEIARRVTEQFASTFQTASTETTDAISETGQKVADTAAANTDAATKKAGDAAKKATDNAKKAA